VRTVAAGGRIAVAGVELKLGAVVTRVRQRVRSPLAADVDDLVVVVCC